MIKGKLVQKGLEGSGGERTVVEELRAYKHPDYDKKLKQRAVCMNVFI